jgi:hypothetical protein
MYPIRIIISFLWVVTLGGCMMMGGMGSMHSTGEMGDSGHRHTGRNHDGWLSAETHRGDLTLTLSFPDPQIDVTVPIEARLYKESDDQELTDVSVRLLISTPDGSKDQIRMRQPKSSATGTYEAQYNFSAAGTYIVTIDGRIGMGAEVSSISVSIETECSTETHNEQHHWPHSMGFMGGVGMILFAAAMHMW